MSPALSTRVIRLFLALAFLTLSFGCGGGGGGGGGGDEGNTNNVSPETALEALIVSPTADMTITEGGSVSFQGKVTGGSEPYTFNWTFGNYMAGFTVRNPGYVTFNTPGAFVATFKVTDSEGTIATDTVTIHVQAHASDTMPEASIVSPSGNVSILTGQSVRFEGSVSGGNKPLSYAWDFGKAASGSSVEDPGNIVFNNAGEYTVTFSVTDADGDTDSQSRHVTVNDPVVYTWYRDSDGDGYGDPAVSLQAVSKPASYVSNNGDCEDNDATIHPGATEICGDGIDQDCSGSDQSCMSGTIRVPADYATIQAAIDAASDGSTILVSNGTYQENVRVTKGVVLKSVNGYGSTNIVAANGNTHVIEVKHGDVTIDGFTIYGAALGTGYPYSAAIYSGDGNTGCTIQNNRCGYDTAHSSVMGISLYSADNTLVANNIVMGNSRNGMYLGPFSDNNTFSGNTVSGNYIGMYIATMPRNNLIFGNVFSGNSYGMILDNASGNNIYQNSLLNNTSANVYAYGSSCTWHSPAQVSYHFNGASYSGYLGNYYSDYVTATGGNDNDANGIGSVPYCVDKTNNAADQYPLWQIAANYTLPVWYQDSDRDGYSSGVSLCSASRPYADYYLASELIATSGDLYDDDPDSYPGAEEVCGDGQDNDCDGLVDEGCEASPGYVSLNSSTPQMSGITFDYLNAIYDSGNGDLPYWAINATGGYMEFSFTGPLDFFFHAFGEPSNGISQSYIDIFINGVRYLTNLLIDNVWQWYKIASSLFTSGLNIVKIVLAGATDFCINEVITAGNVTIWYLDADGDGFGDPAHSVLASSQPSGYVDNNSDLNDGDGGSNLDSTYTNSVGMTFKLIPAGTFMMGSPPEELGRKSDETLHEVTITKAFYIQTTEVTQAQWAAVMGSNPSYFTGYPNRPVERISWNNVQEFINELNKRGEGTYRLPTEAEWEYAARSGSDTAFANGGITQQYGGDDPILSAIGFFSYNSGSATHIVASKIPNAWGLYDMHGNVSELCSDWYGPYSGTAETDPTGPLTGTYKVIRGGSWWEAAKGCRSASRSYSEPQIAGNYFGLRIVRVSTVLPIWYRDSDNDGFGDPAVLTRSATQPSGYVANNSDCNDSNSSIHPGAAEICGDGIDQDCNGSDLACALYTWYRDADNDGYGNPDVSVQSASQPSGYVADHRDLNDNNASIHPGAYEIINNGIDEDCNGSDLVYPVSSIIRVPADYSTIQAAVNAADAGDVILVAGGTYTENINITKHVIVRSEGGYGMTTVVASSAGDHVFDVRANYVTIEGFTIYGAGQGYSGIYLGPYPSGATYCTVSHNRVGIDAGHRNYNGLYLHSASHNTISWNILTSDQNYAINLTWYSDYNTIENNTVSSCAGGIDIALESDNNTVRANSFISNSSAGVYITSSSTGNSISGNFISSSYSGIGLSESAYGNLIEKNTCASNSGGIVLTAGAHHNTIRENSCVGSIYFGISISGVTNNTIYLNSFTNSTAGNVYLGDNQTNTWHSPSTITYYYDNAEHTGYLGNYYDDYVAKTGGNDNDGNGIGSLPYPIGATHADEDVYPLWKEPDKYLY